MLDCRRCPRIGALGCAPDGQVLGDPLQGALSAALATQAAAGLKGDMLNFSSVFTSFYEKKSNDIFFLAKNELTNQYSPENNYCHANDEDNEAENTEHNDDKQEGRVE